MGALGSAWERLGALGALGSAWNARKRLGALGNAWSARERFCDSGALGKESVIGVRMIKYYFCKGWRGFTSADAHLYCESKLIMHA
eukprot:2078909-Pyramimonas_sp.AAC.1